MLCREVGGGERGERKIERERRRGCHKRRRGMGERGRERMREEVE